MPSPESHAPSGTGLETRHVFLDTEAYRQYLHNLYAPPLRSLKAQMNDHVFILHTTDITNSEIERQIRELAVEAARAVNKANKSFRQWRARSLPVEGYREPDDVDAVLFPQLAVEYFRLEMAEEWKPQEHKALETPAAAIFNRYFLREAPFDKGDSKEFPDAFVIETLDRWCTENYQRMYVVSRDAAMQRAAAKTFTLIPVSSVEELLQIAAEGQSPDIVERVARILSKPDVVKYIEDSVRKQLDQLEVAYTGNLFDAHVIGHPFTPDPPHLLDFRVISVSPEDIEVVAKLRVSLITKLQFLDTSEATYDEHSDLVGTEEFETEIEDEVTISAFIVIDAQKENVIDLRFLTQQVRIREEPD